MLRVLALAMAVILTLMMMVTMMMVMRTMTRTTTIARLTIMMVATVMINLFRCSTRKRTYRVRVDKAYWRIAGSVKKLADIIASSVAMLCIY